MKSVWLSPSFQQQDFLSFIKFLNFFWRFDNEQHKNESDLQKSCRSLFLQIDFYDQWMLLTWRTDDFQVAKKIQNSITLQWNALSSGQSVIRFLARQTKKQQKQLTFKFHKLCYVKLFWFTYLSMFFNYHNLKKNPFYLGQNFQMKILTFDLLNYYFCHPLIKTDDLGWQSIFFLRFKN
jgi:hypothetical protein